MDTGTILLRFQGHLLSSPIATVHRGYMLLKSLMHTKSPLLLLGFQSCWHHFLTLTKLLLPHQLTRALLCSHKLRRVPSTRLLLKSFTWASKPWFLHSQNLQEFNKVAHFNIYILCSYCIILYIQKVIQGITAYMSSLKMKI